MADFKEDAKQNVKEGLRDRLESNTGIVGDALRARREQKEKEKQTHEEVAAVNSVTAKMKISGTSLTNMEKSFTQMSENLQLIAKAFKAQTTTFEETQATYLPQQAQQAQRQTKQAPSLQNLTKDSEEDSLFQKVSDLIDGFDTARKAYRAVKAAARVVKGAVKGAAKGIAKGAAKGVAEGVAKAAGKAGAKEAAKKASEAAIKTSARKILAKSLGKLVGKSIPIAGAAVGIGFAVGKIMQGDWVGAGVEAVSGLGSAVTAIPATIYGAAREVYFDVYGVWPEPDPKKEERFGDLYSIVKSMAADLLRDNVKANESDAESARLRRQAVPVSAPPVAAGPAAAPPVALPPTGAGGGRGVAGGPQLAESVKSVLTPSQLEWLGNADPTDSAILARMPKPTPEELAVAPPPIPVAAPPLPAKPAPGAPTLPSAAPVAKPVAGAPTQPPPTPAAPPPAAAAGAPKAAGKPTTTPTAVSGGEAAMEQALKEQGFDSTAIAAIMAQTSHESGHFKILQENLNYSASGLKSIFGKYFDASTAEQYAKQPEKIANRVYANRMGNGPEESGDGFKYRGRGFIQLTGKTNYAAAGQSLGLDLVNSPDMAAEPKNAASIAIWYFKKNIKRITNWADTLNITKIVNGGTIGLADRQKEFESYMAKYAGGATAVSGGSDASAGKEIAQKSTEVASTKKAQQAGSSVTVIAINNNTQTKVEAAKRPPLSQTTAVVGA